MEGQVRGVLVREDGIVLQVPKIGFDIESAIPSYAEMKKKAAVFGMSMGKTAVAFETLKKMLDNSTQEFMGLKKVFVHDSVVMDEAGFGDIRLKPEKQWEAQLPQEREIDQPKGFRKEMKPADPRRRRRAKAARAQRRRCR
jgi:hypothetical protein